MTSIDFLNLLLRYRALVLGLPIVLGLLLAGTALAKSREYTAVASFAPQSSEARSGLSGMAAQLGLQIAAGTNTRSPAFYAQLVQSRIVLDSAVTGGASGQSLVDELAADEPPQKRKGRALERLKENLTVSTGRETGLVKLEVTSRDPQLSAVLAERLLAVLNELNLEHRRALAAEERRFAQGRLEEVQAELLAAEERQRRFLEQNRQFENSWALQFEHDRLQREVMNRQQIYTAMTQSYEQARMDEVRNIPLITVVEPPSVPLEPDGRGVVRMGLLGGFGGGMLAILIAAMLDSVRRARETNQADVAEFDELKRKLWRRRRQVGT